MLFTILLVAGCTEKSTSSAPASQPAGPRSPSIAMTQTAPVGSASLSPSRSSGSPARSSIAPVGPAPCPTNVLRLGPGASNGAGGTNYLTYPMTNAGTASCTLFGYPGVSVLDANRHQVQQPAVRAPQLAPTGTRLGQVTLAPGAEAFFVLSVIDTDPDPDCPNPRTGTELRVFPPNQTAPILQPGQFQACQAHVSYVFTR